jgi:hypothetical protein
MSRLVAILAALFLFAIPAKADVALWLHPIPGWTVINVYGLIKPADVRTFEYYTENVNPDATLVTLSSGGGNLWAGIGMGKRVRQKKLIVGVIGTCASSCALIWIGGETGRKFFYQNASLCFHQASYIKGESDYTLSRRIIQSAPGNPLISEYLTKLGYSQDMIECWDDIDLTKRTTCGLARFKRGRRNTDQRARLGFSRFVDASRSRCSRRCSSISSTSLSSKAVSSVRASPCVRRSSSSFACSACVSRCPVRLMNRVIIHVANDATAAQPNVPGEKRSHATVKAATMANAVGWVVNSPRRVSARRNASIINVKATGSKAVPPAAAGGMRRRLVKTHRDIPMF